MTLTLRVLGTATPYPGPDEPCAGYLVRTPATTLLVELGLAVWPSLLRHVDPSRLDAIWISHLHPDHSGDLLAAYQWAANGTGLPRLPIHGPAGWADSIGAALAVPDGPARLRRLFDVREHSGAVVHLGDLTMTAIPVEHSVPTYGLRLGHDGRTLAYSGDSGPCAALSALAADADVFLCEAGSTSPGQPHHCAPEEAARIGRSARRLVLTHLAPGLAGAEAARRAPGATIAYPGLSLRIPDTTAPQERE